MKKTTSIFRQILFTVSVPEILIFLVISVFSYFQLNDIFEKLRFEKLELLNKESEVILDLRENALTFTNKYLDLFSETSIEKLINYCEDNNVNPANIDLDKFIKDNDLLKESCDFYVIDTSGVIVNTSFDEDLGLNFANFGPKYKALLERQFASKKIHIDDFSVETKTKKLRKYAYQALPDGSYLIEFGIYSEEHKLLKNSVVKGLEGMVKSQKNIEAVDIITSSDGVPYSLYNPDLKIEAKEAKLINSLLSANDTSYFEIHGRLIYNYKVFPRKAGQIYEQLMVRVEYNRTQDLKFLQKELLRKVLIFAIGIAILFFILYRNVKRLVQPVLQLSQKAKIVGDGNLSERAEVVGSNEISELAYHFNNMVDNLESSQNELIHKNEEILAQSNHIEEQREVLVHKNEQIMGSINYAKRIQTALLKSDSETDMPENFIYFRPKDLVSGDFYWVLGKQDYIYIVAGDCTGHGVPGAFVTMLGTSFLDEINSITEILSPAEILDQLRDKIVKSLSQTGATGESKDGMDISLIRINMKNNDVEWAGSNNPIYIIRQDAEKNPISEAIIKDNVEVIKGNREPIGYTANPSPFTNYSLKLKKGDVVYLFSDGYADQFGGEENKKLGYRRLRQMAYEIHNLPMSEQKEIFSEKFQSWLSVGDSKQIDDVVVIGIRI